MRHKYVNFPSFVHRSFIYSFIHSFIHTLSTLLSGIVRDGGVDTVAMATVGSSDVKYQLDKWSVTAQFSGFTSHLHGLSRFDWAVGTTAGGEEVMPFSVLGIIHDEAESGTPGNGQCMLSQCMLTLSLPCSSRRHSKNYQ